MGIAGMSSTLRYAVQTHESTFSDSLLSNLPVAPPIIELVVALLLLAIGAAEEVVAAAAATTGTALLLLLLEPLALAPATADAAAEDDFEAPLSLAQLNLSPQLPFFDLAPVEDALLAATELEPLFDC